MKEDDRKKRGRRRGMKPRKDKNQSVSRQAASEGTDGGASHVETGQTLSEGDQEPPPPPQSDSRKAKRRRTTESSVSDTSEDSVDIYRAEVSDSEEAVDQTEVEDRTTRRALTDVDLLMREWVPADQVEQEWDNGLSPLPLYSFQHCDTKCRHWAESEVAESFLCKRPRSEGHHRGGDPQMDVLRGICSGCLRRASTDPNVLFKQYVARQIGDAQ